MILNSLTIRGFRGFFEGVTIDIAPDITVLTGANDAGKSTVLDVLRWINEDLQFGEDDVNFDFDEKSVTPWKQNIEIGAHATYTILSDNNYLRQGVAIGWKVEFVCRLMSKEIVVSKVTDVDGKEIRLKNRDLVRRPRVVNLSKQEDIGTEISKESVNPSTNKLLELAFIGNYWETIGSLSPKNQKMRRAAANLRLNSRLRDVKPDSLPIEFDIDFVSHSPLVFSVGLVDELGGRAWLPQRGAGYQKLIKLMFTLLTVDAKSDNVMLIYDEPETSLHADAQHSFRRVLEDIADQPNFQVIYATHSPAMINPRRPKSLRLLTRERNEDGVATTKIHNKTYTESNYQSVRSQLGVLPADSLMFASITVIVEGPTERLALNSLVAKIIRESDDDQHKGLKLLWQLTFVVSAGGSGRIPYWIEFAKGQGVKPIVLVDGDKISDARRWKKDFADVEIFHLDDRKELEDLVPPEIYIKALAEVLAEVGKASDKIAKAEFDKWWQSSGLPEQMMFSKRVYKWLRSEFGTCPDKPKVMDKAIELAEFNRLKLDNINQVIKAIRELANDPK